MKVLAVINPISGELNKKGIIAELLKFSEENNVELFQMETTGKNDSEALANKINEIKPNRLIAIGGDGTALLCAKQILNTDISLGIVPAGSANGMASELQLPTNTSQASKVAISSQVTKNIDLLQVNEHLSMHIGDVGINAAIVKQYDSDPARGMATYGKYLLSELKKLETFSVELSTKEQHLKAAAYLVAFCNARTYGTGFEINSDGKLNDGLFEIVIIKPPNEGIEFSIQNAENPFYQVIQTDQATLKFQKNQTVQLDGEVIGELDRLEIKIMPGAISVVL